MFCTTCYGHSDSCDCGVLQPKPAIAFIRAPRNQLQHAVVVANEKAKKEECLKEMEKSLRPPYRTPRPVGGRK